MANIEIIITDVTYSVLHYWKMEQLVPSTTQNTLKCAVGLNE